MNREACEKDMSIGASDNPAERPGLTSPTGRWRGASATAMLPPSYARGMTCPLTPKTPSPGCPMPWRPARPRRAPSLSASTLPAPGRAAERCGAAMSWSPRHRCFQRPTGPTSCWPTGGAWAPALPVATPVPNLVALRLEQPIDARLPAAAEPRLGEFALALAAGAGGETMVRMGVVRSVGPAWQSLLGGRIDRRISLDLVISRAEEGGPSSPRRAGSSACRRRAARPRAGDPRGDRRARARPLADRRQESIAAGSAWRCTRWRCPRPPRPNMPRTAASW